METVWLKTHRPVKDVKKWSVEEQWDGLDYMQAGFVPLPYSIRLVGIWCIDREPGCWLHIGETPDVGCERWAHLWSQKDTGSWMSSAHQYRNPRSDKADSGTHLPRSHIYFLEENTHIILYEH